MNAAAPNVYLDITDLIQWVKKNDRVTGIQRVHLNYALHAMSRGVRFIMFHGRACADVTIVDPAVINYMGELLSGQIPIDNARLWRLCPNARLETWQDYRDKYSGKPAKYYWHSMSSALKFYLTQLLFRRHSPGPDFRPGDVLLNVGRSWTIGGYVQNIEKLKRRHGISAQLLLHDVIQIGHIQNPGESRIFTRFIRESFQSFDRFFTSSEYNRGEIRRYMQEFCGSEKPILKSFFGQQINSEGSTQAPLPEGLAPQRYLLTVGRVAESKNQARLLEAWARVLEAGQDGGLQLVVVGQLNRKYRAFNELLESKPLLRQRVRVISNASDQELDTLYRHCYFTVFPSLIEGFGLPAAESVSYGKFCLASNATSIPEAAGEHAAFFDPLDVSDIHAKLAQFIQSPALLREREAAIRATPLKSWAEATEDLLSKARLPLPAPVSA